MTKRKISSQQQRRIHAKQAQLLDTEELVGLVIAHHGQYIEIENVAAEIIMCKKRQHLGPIVAGDRVRWQFDPATQTGVVTAIESRKSLLSRPDARGTLHAVAANVDQMFIVIAPTPAPNPTTVDRYLLTANAQNIKPIIVLNKEDLLPNDRLHSDLLNFLQIYTNIGISTLIISAKKLQHLSLLHAAMENAISVFVGQSGVGKSSIIATLLPDVQIKVGDLSTALEQGKHTTTTARLYHVAKLNADLIDSPGMREFPLWKLDPATLAQGFTEFAPFLHACKFRNCMHNNELGCALSDAANNGKIAPARLASYQKLLAEMQTGGLMQK